jgi:hypothetical protein
MDVKKIQNFSYILPVAGIHNMKKVAFLGIIQHGKFVEPWPSVSYCISYCLRATEMLVQMRCVMLRCCEGEHQGYESCPVTLELLVI